MEDNVAIGYHALKQADNANIDKCVAIGSYALEKYDTHTSVSSAGYGKHTAVGFKALRNTGLATNHIAIGNQAMLGRNTSGELDQAINGSGNLAVGAYAFRFQATGSYNAALGFSTSSLSSNLSGNYNTSLGYGARPSAASSSYQFTLGNGDTSNLRCNDTSISSLSLLSDKDDIDCLLYTSPSPRDGLLSRMPSSA